MNLLIFLVCVERVLLQSCRQFLPICCGISSIRVQPKFAIGLVKYFGSKNAGPAPPTA